MATMLSSAIKNHGCRSKGQFAGFIGLRRKGGRAFGREL